MDVVMFKIKQEKKQNITISLTDGYEKWQTFL